MYIIKCHIENFGKLHQFDYEFSNGLNTINEINGWGKSTFATFIKAMFYGLESTNRKSLDENERKKYYPWQGGKYGGSIQFKINENIYEIERFFGVKEKDDTFRLYNKNTNCESHDFSERIGEEIFKIDKNAYERSTYIPQKKISIEMNDSLNAKLSNLLENENDINSSDKAINNINNIMKEYRKTGNRGKINDIERIIATKKMELEKAKKNEELINERNRKIINLEKKINELQIQKDSNQIEINNILEYEKNKIKLERYQEFINNIEENEKQIKELMNYFNNQIPNDNEISEMENYTYKLDLLIARLDECIVEDNERNKYEILKKQFKKIEISTEKFEEIINDYYELENIKKQNEILKEQLEGQKEIKKLVETEKLKNKKILKIKIFLSIIIFILSIIAGYLISKKIYTISVIIFIYFISNLFLSKKKSKRNDNENEIKNIKDKINKKSINQFNLEDKINRFIKMFDANINIDLNKYQDNEIIRNIENNNSNNEKINDPNNDIYNKIENNLNRNNNDCSTSIYNKKIIEIRNKYNEYLNLENLIYNKENKRNLLLEEINKIVDILYLKLFNYLDEKINKNNLIEFNQKSKNMINNIKNNKNKLNNLIIKYENNKKIKINFEKENDIKDYIFNLIKKENNNYLDENNNKLLESNLEDKNIDNEILKNEIKQYIDKIINDNKLSENKKLYINKNSEIEKQITNLINQKIYDENEMNRLINTSITVEEMENEIEMYEQKLEELEYKYKILEKTKKYLIKAKENFSSHYLSNMVKGFEKYIKEINEENLNTSVDIKLNIKINEYGENKESEYLSTGYQDLIGICMRFSLIDALFENERPFIILDDPFVNLDENKINKAIKVVNKFAEKYQVIYFICHKSRS
jgi:uncharacterized protein YhaN